MVTNNDNENRVQDSDNNHDEGETYQDISSELDDTVELVDPRGNPNFKEILVYVDPVDKHAKYHEIDKFNMLVEEMKESMDFIVQKDPTLEPLTVYNAVVQEYTNKLGNEEKSELLAVLSQTKVESHLRRLGKLKEKIIGQMPKSQSEFDPSRLEDMPDGSKLQWISSTYKEKEEKRCLVFSTAYLLYILQNCSKLSCDGTFKVMSRLWSQLFIVMGFFGGTWLPLVFGYLPGKTILDYETFFTLLTDLMNKCHGVGSNNMQCKKLLCDFEKAIHKGADNVLNKKLRLGMKIKGCFFHYSSVLWKIIQKTGGVKKYIANKSMRKMVRCCVGFAHCPPNRLEEAYNYVNKNFNF